MGRRPCCSLVALSDSSRDFGVRAPSQVFLHRSETRAGELGGGLEIHEAKRATEIVMGLRCEGMFAHRAEYVTLHVAVLVASVGHFILRQIRYSGQLPGKLLVRRL